MACTLTYVSQVQAVETIEANVPFAAANSRVITHGLFNSSETLTGSTAVPVVVPVYTEFALSSGALTIDLRSILGSGNSPFDLNGMKVQVVKLRCKSSNANPITISEGATNGYELLGNGFTFQLKPSQEITMHLKDLSPDVGASAKTIDLTGTGSQVLEVAIIAG